MIELTPEQTRTLDPLRNLRLPLTPARVRSTCSSAGRFMTRSG